MDEIKLIQKEGHLNFNVISLTQLIKCLMMTIDKKEFIALLDKYLGRGHFVDVDNNGLMTFGRKERTPQTVTDEKEDILNLLELKPELHLTSMQIKWLNEWQHPQNTAPEPQQEQTKKTRGRGRPKETLKDKMLDDTDGKKLQTIHTKICGKKGKDATLIILACIKKGWMTRPTYTQVKNEFGDIGSKTGYNRYLNEQAFTKEELEGVINSLD